MTSLLADAAHECSPALAGVTGTHALSLDAFDAPLPQVPGLGRWTLLRPDHDDALSGELRAWPEALPFVDASFCVVLIRYIAGCGLQPNQLAHEAARVLAPHGLLLVVELHPWSAWRPWLNVRVRHAEPVPYVVPPRRWRRALRAAGLVVGETRRCGAPWPRTDGMRGLPRWAGRCGGAYLLQARKRDGVTLITQRPSTVRPRATAEHTTWAPGAHRSHG